MMTFSLLMLLPIVILIACLVGIRETAKRRGGPAWPFVVLGVVAFFVGESVGVALLGAGPHLFVAWGALLMVYLSVFVLTGKGKRAEASWQCGDCTFWNEPTMLICRCGKRYEQTTAA